MFLFKMFIAIDSREYYRVSERTKRAIFRNVDHVR